MHGADSLSTDKRQLCLSVEGVISKAAFRRNSQTHFLRSPGSPCASGPALEADAFDDRAKRGGGFHSLFDQRDGSLLVWHTKTAITSTGLQKQGARGRPRGSSFVVLTGGDFVTQAIGFLVAPPVLGCLLRPCNSEVAGWVQRAGKESDLGRQHFFQAWPPAGLWSRDRSHGWEDARELGVNLWGLGNHVETPMTGLKRGENF